MQYPKNELECIEMKRIPYTFFVGSLMYGRLVLGKTLVLLLKCWVGIKVIQVWIIGKL